MGAAIATAALLAGFGSALLVYGPLGTPSRQIGGTTLNVAPKGVTFGNAAMVFANGLNLTNFSGMGWTWSYNATGVFNGPCNSSGVLAPNGSYIYNHTSAANAVPLMGNVTLVCLNSVSNGSLNATWYYAANGSQLTHTNYTALGGVVLDSYYADSFQNVSSCSNFTMFHDIMTKGLYNGSYYPCQTYFAMNNNTNWLPSFQENNSTIWSPYQNGYAPNDIVYAIPVEFANTAPNGTYAISIAIAGVTPVAQTFYFNATGVNATVLFTFDMTAAWLMDLTFANATSPANTSLMAIYGSIGVVSSIVTECGSNGVGQAVCPVVTKM